MKTFFFNLTIGVIVFLLEALLVKYLWNLLFPLMFNAPFLDYWQALAILMLSNILFKSHSQKKSES